MGKKDNIVVCVVSNLTSNQANDLYAAIGKAKNKVAPNARGRAAITTRAGIGELLQESIKKIKG